ncbi:hypothetical protein OG21DRAFT_1498073 [Imleria badia]|nr:hypothetical protein OG21DRAFT_1498073 [Imleria badia]
MSFTLLLLQDTVGVSSTQALIEEATTFISHVLPPMLCYLGMALLTIRPQTRTIRIALLPVTVLLAVRTAVPVDMSLKITERRFHHYLAVWVFVTTIRAPCTPSTLMDALDLVSNLRGYGWDWSHGTRFPCETRPSNSTGFIFYTTLSVAAHAFAFGIIHTTIRSFSSASFGTLSSGSIFDETRPFLHRAIRVCFPVGRGDISAGSIFDESIPFYLRFLRSSIITVLALAWIYTGLQTQYNLCTILGVHILRQDPIQWPPLFDAPWRATSVTHFWGRRWHQRFRKIFLILGGYPLSFILGRVGIVIGAFFISTVYHHIGLLMHNSKSEFWRMLVGFEMMGMGILIEDVFRYVTGREVRGLAGWVWMAGWMLLWGNVIIDGYMRAGKFGFPTWVDLVPPLRTLVEYLVTEFDTLLHAISSVPVA